MIVLGKTRHPVWFLLALTLLLLAACGGGEEPVSDGPSPLAQTATALAVGVPEVQEPTNNNEAESAGGETPEPPAPAEEDGGESTEAEVVEPPPVSDEINEAEKAATALAEELAATVAAEEANVAALAATKEAQEAPILAELQNYGISTGQLTHIYDRVTLEENQFEGAAYDEPSLAAKARNFVVAADITWWSRFGESGCGFAVRSNGNPDALNQYLIGITRGAEGHLLFAEQINGDVDLDLVTDIFPRTEDPQFDWKNESTNRIVIVGRGEDFTIYSNGSELGTVTGTAGLEDGFVAFFALNRSGGVRCTFDNAWLWEMD